MINVPISILDQCPIYAGTSAESIIDAAIGLAQLADRSGFRRIWYAEHHGNARYASSSPEVMIALTASKTRRISVGSGGVMLRHHAPIRVAETFGTLSAAFPSRVDLGIGSGVGGHGSVSLAFGRSLNVLTLSDYRREIESLMSLFAGGSVHGIHAVPQAEVPPDVWLLGTTTESGELAGELGLGYAFGHHLNPSFAKEAIAGYRASFRPSMYRETPYSIISVEVICADNAAKANQLALTQQYAEVQLRTQTIQPIVANNTLTSRHLTDEELAWMEGYRARQIVGGISEVEEGLQRICREFNPDELMAVTVVDSISARMRSFKLLSRLLGDSVSGNGG